MTQEPSDRPTDRDTFPLARTLGGTQMREGGTFWRDVVAFQETVAPIVLPRVLAFCLWSFLVSLAHRYTSWEPAPTGVVEFMGAFLAMMLVLRTNSGYDRWWEGRRMWASIVNQSRNLVVTALAFGPRQRPWDERFVRWAAVYAHVCHRSLRNERTMPEVERLVGAVATARILAAPHAPTYVSHVLAEIIAEAHHSGWVNTAIYRQLELQRTQLVDHLGNCERIVQTRFPRAHRSMLGQLIVLYLISFPIAVVDQGFVSEALLMLPVAYTLFSLDQMARELGNPFSRHNRSHLPIEELAAALEESLLACLAHPVHLDAPPILPPKSKA